MIRSFFIPVLLGVLIVGTSSCSKKTDPTADLARAEKYFVAGKYDEAELVYRDVLRIDSENPIAIKRMGLMAFEQGSVNRALVYLVKASHIDPTDFDTRILMASAAASVGERTMALLEYSDIFAEDPGNDKAMLLVADMAFTPEIVVEVRRFLADYLEAKGEKTAVYHLASGRLAMWERDADTALIEINRAIELDPKLMEAHLALAGQYAGRRDMEAAGKEMALAAGLAPPRSGVHLKYVEFLLKNGDREGAVRHLEKITEETPDFLQAWVVRTEMAWSDQDYELAESHLMNVLSRDSWNLNGRTLAAKMKMAQGDISGATFVFEKLVQAYPETPSARLNLAMAQVNAGESAAASVTLLEALEINPYFTEAALLLGNIHFNAGNPELAVDVVTPLLERDPSSFAAQILLANAYRKLGLLDEAATIFRNQIRAVPDRAMPYRFLGSVLREQGKHELAHACLSDGTKHAPGDYRMLHLLILVELDLERFDEAHRMLDKRIEVIPESAGLHFLKGLVFAGQEDWSSATDSLKTAIGHDSSFSEAYALLITAYLESDSLEEAKREAEIVLEKQPDDIPTLLLAAGIQSALGDFSNAVETYNLVLEQDGRQLEALNNLAFIYAAELDQPEQGLKLAQLAYAQDTDSPDLNDTLGWVLFQLRKYDEAVTRLEFSVSIRPDDPESRYHLGMAHYMMGHTEAAANEFRAVAKSDWRNLLKDDAARRLFHLEAGAKASIDELEKVVEEDPDDPLAWVLLAEAYEKAYKPEKAAKAASLILSKYPKLLRAVVILSRLYSGPLADPEKALSYAKMARAISPDSAEVDTIFGVVVLKAGELPAAFDLLEAVVEDKPDDETLYYFAGAAFGLGKFEASTESLERILAMEKSPWAEDAKSFKLLSGAVVDRAKLATVKASAETISKDDLRYLPAVTVRILSLLEAGDLDAAKSLCEEALKVYPDFVPVQKELAALYAKDKDKLDDALRLGMRAREYLPKDEELAVTLAEISYRLGDLRYTEQLLEGLDGSGEGLSAESRFFLGMAYLDRKKINEGKRLLREAIADGLNTADRSVAKKALFSTTLGGK